MWSFSYLSPSCLNTNSCTAETRCEHNLTIHPVSKAQELLYKQGPRRIHISNILYTCVHEVTKGSSLPLQIVTSYFNVTKISQQTKTYFRSAFKAFSSSLSVGSSPSSWLSFWLLLAVVSSLAVEPSGGSTS